VPHLLFCYIINIIHIHVPGESTSKGQRGQTRVAIDLSNKYTTHIIINLLLTQSYMIIDIYDAFRSALRVSDRGLVPGIGSSPSPSPSSSSSSSMASPQPDAALRTGMLLGPSAIRSSMSHVVPTMERIIASILGTGAPPLLRTDDHMDAHHCPDVKESIAWILRGRPWKAVSLQQFLSRVHSLARQVAQRLLSPSPLHDAGPCKVCIAIDNLQKSSFWMAMMILNYLTKEGVDISGVRMVVSFDATLLKEAFSQLQRATPLLLLDDAAYSGLQITEYASLVMDAFGDAHEGNKPMLYMGIPFVSATASHHMATKLSADHVTVMGHEAFKGVFSGRSPRAILRHDIIIMTRSRRLDTNRARTFDRWAYQSFYYDFLRLRDSHTTLVFQHKIPDAVSIPHMWLHIGPIVDPKSAVLYRLKPSKLTELLRIVEHLTLRNHPTPRDVMRCICEWFGAVGFDKASQYIDEVHCPAGRPTNKKRPRIFPILAEDSCTEDYARYMAMLHDDTDMIADYYYTMPDCFTPPYKHASMRAAIQRAQKKKQHSKQKK
jgi:hypothetical protein